MIGKRNALCSFGDHLPSLLVWLLAAIVFARSLIGLAETTIVHDQIGAAAIVLLFGLLLMMHDLPTAGSAVWKFGRRACMFLAVAGLLAMTSGLFRQPLLMPLAMGFLAGAVLLFIYGDPVFHVAVGFACAFFVFTCLAIFFPLADWPLRLLTGRTAMWFLDLVGSQSHLGFIGDPPKLILMSDGKPFVVASECNGFGIISGCILLALLLVFSRRLRLIDKITVLVFAPLLGLFSNALRILLIVLLAPKVGENYFIMHEIIGVVLFLSTLLFLWWLVLGLPSRRKYHAAMDSLPASKKSFL